MLETTRSPRRTWLLALLMLLFAFWSVRSGRVVVPDRWNPWAPLDVRASPGPFTGFKLSRASADPSRCLDVLSQSDFRLVVLDDRQTGVGCGFENAVRIERSSVAIGEPFSLSCRAALSLAIWEHHVLQRAAKEHLGTRVVAIEHFGSYACRNLYGREGGRRSQHATADALDVAGFALQDGRRVRVVNDWAEHAAPERTPHAEEDGPGDSAKAAFLRAVHEGACNYFDTVLGPDYNRAHADHFHFDRGRARICR